MKSPSIPRLLVLLTTIAMLVSISSGGTIWHGSAQAAAISVTLNPVADSFVSEGLPGISYGGSTTLRVARSEFLHEDIALLRFSLASIPARATIASAQLLVYLRSADSGSVAIGVSRVAAPWNPGTVTWNTRPPLVCCSGSTTVGTSNNYYPLNITDLVNSWVNAPATYPNYGLALRGPADLMFGRSFDSNEGPNRPRLVVSYTLPTPTPTPTQAATATGTPTNTPLVTDTPTNTPLVTNTPTPTARRTPPPSPSPTDVPRGSIGDLVWNDADRDGIRDSGEPGLAGVRLELARDGVIIADARTDASGNYHFAGLGAGSYRVSVDPWSVSPVYELVSGTNPRAVTLLAGQNITSVDFGYALPVASPAPEARAIALEVNQSVQDRLFFPDGPGTIKNEDSELLIGGKDTVVRYYVVAKTAVPSFTASLFVHVERTDGTRFDRIIPPNAGTTSVRLPVGPSDPTERARLLAQMRADLSSTLNYVIPARDMADARLIQLNLNTIPRISGAVQLSLRSPVMLGLNVVRISSRFTGPVVSDAIVDTNILSYLKATYPADEVRVLSRRTFSWDGFDLGDVIGANDQCSALLHELWWAYGGDDAPVVIDPGRPIWISTLGVASALRPCLGIAYLGDPDDDEDRTGGTALTTLFGDTAAHEIGHTIGLIHVSNDHDEGGGGEWERWYYPHGELGPFDFGIFAQPTRAPAPGDSGQWQLALIDPCPTADITMRFPSCMIDHSAGTQPHELMSYGVSTLSASPLVMSKGRWISSVTLKRLYSAIRYRTISPPLHPGTFASPRLAQTASSDRAEAFLVGGAIQADGTARLAPLLHKPMPRALIERPSSGPYTLELLGRDGAILLSRAFAATHTGDSSQDLIREVVPYVEGVQRIVIKKDGQVLLNKAASANPPQVRLLSPNGGETLQGVQTISWEAQDSDGDALSFLVQYSPDGGQRWQGVALVRPGSPLTAQLDVGELIPGQQGLIRVVASDGINTTVDVSDAFFTVKPGARIYLPMARR